MTITREEFEDKSFSELVEMLYEERDDITTYDRLKEYAIEKIKEDNLHLGLFILNKMYNSDCYFPADTDWYQWDFTSGTCSFPRELNTKDDIEELFEFKED